MFIVFITFLFYFSLEMNICKKNNDLEQHVNEYNELIELINLKDKSNYYLKLNINHENNIFSIDLKNIIKPLLISIKKSLQDKINNIQKDTRNLATLLLNEQEIKNDLLENINISENRLKKLEDNYKNEREFIHKLLNNIINDVEDIELENHKLKSILQQTMNVPNTSIDTLNEQYTHLQQQYESEIETIKNEICIVLEEITTHKVNINEVLEQLVQHSENVMEQMKTV
jgi:SMC interacting uncharacterized protein involved in chromosome segregation